MAMMMQIAIAAAPSSTSSAATAIPLHPFTSHLPISGTKNLVTRRNRKGFVECSSVSSSKNDDDCGVISRRDAMVQIQTAFCGVILQNLWSPSPALADDVPADVRVYSDDVNKYKIFIPQDWLVGAGQGDGFKSITAFYPDEAASTSNVSVVITNIGPDFTRLESFGKVEAFAENLVSGLDRSWQRPPGVTAKLIDSKSANGFYYIEYTLQNPGESCRHIYSAIGMANNGWYNRLYTITGQFLEEEAGKYESKIEKAVRSFRFS